MSEATAATVSMISVTSLQASHTKMRKFFIGFGVMQFEPNLSRR